MLVVLYIGYAFPHCTTDMVRAKFDSMFSNCVSSVVERHCESRTGQRYKRFWITVESQQHDPTMIYVLDAADKTGFAKVYYETTPDRHTKNPVPRYWKVKATLIGDMA